MSKELVDLVQAKLKEDTWTRATISNYTKNNLIELTTIVEKAKSEDCVNEIKEICDEQLSHTRDSITALYISGMLALKQGSLDTSSLETLIDIFQNNHKEPIVVYICETILADDKSNKFALRALSSIYEQTGNDELWDIYEKIVKVDFNEAEIAKKLAEHYISENPEKANEFYKKALLRYVNNRNINAANEIWSKLTASIPEEIDFFYLVQRKIAKSISADKSALMMQELYNWYKENKKWDTAIDILKLNLAIDPKDPWARREIADCYAQKYEKHSHVGEYIRSSDLTQSYRNVFEAISDFEKHIAFDAKHFVFHRTWGVGVITKVENDTLTINFGKNGKKDISLKMAVNALQPLSRDHIWVIKATVGSKSSEFKTKEDLAKKIKNDKEWALKIIIKSFDNNCDFKKIKAELVPSILTTSEWTSWNNGAKKILEEDSIFGVNPNNINEYTVRERAITPEEKYSNEFKAQKAFFARIDILYKFIEDEATDKESELLADMFSYFTGFLKSFNEVDEQVIASYLVVQDVGQKVPNLAFQCKYNFQQLYGEIESPKDMYTILKGSKKGDLRASFLWDIKEMLPNWEDEFIAMFPAILKKDVLQVIINAGHSDKVQKLVVDAFEDFRTYRDVILFLFDDCSEEEWFTAAAVPLQKQLIAIVNIISQCYREIDNHVDSTENKKIIKNSCKMLFEKDGNKYATFMLSCDVDQMGHMYTLVDDIREPELDIYRAQLRSKILEKYPDYKFHTTEEKSSAPKGMLVTAKKLEEKRTLVEKMQDVDIPAIAKEVAEAKEKGDLKENAEYIAAKEAQHKLGNDLKRLQEELARAVVFDPTTATTSLISFGTKVTLLDKASGKEEFYTILGPWESDPENGVISYMSPFGNAILDHKVGEELTFTINEHKYNFEVKKIELAKI
ncbi:transcription elongation factor GreA [uncultured Treponema sp.]|uniref:transcription elongation factor GreA n=1 Tax=uncultured Treponema sp. TaxID=162155 RepID=UPI0025E277C3|nr:transcription elongation factor GreA [uncultured Treponema sp.]